MDNTNLNKPNQNMEIGWDDTIQEDGQDLVLLEEGDYNFRVTNFERVRQGQGRPSRIYVKNFLPPLRKSKHKDFDNHSSGTSETKVQGLRISKANNTEKNYTDMNETNRILSGMGCDDDAREQYREYFREKLAIEDLKERYPYDRETLDGIEELILDVVCSGKKTIRVQGENFPAGVVKSRFMKLRFDHIEYVMEQLQKTTTDIRNIRQYIIAALYNAPCTIDSYYRQAVRHDFAYPEDKKEAIQDEGHTL